MLESWIDKELEDVDLADKRLETRFSSLLEQLSQHSQASIPSACDGRSQMVAAYRFFDNRNATFQSVLSPHIEATTKRLQKHPVVLLTQDTTELDLTRPHSRVEGSGPLHNGKRNGALLHLLHAFTPDGTPLGTQYAEAWSRPEQEHPSKRAKRGSSQRRMQCARKPLEAKESVRWLDTAKQCAELKDHCPQTQLVMIADRESDISAVIHYASEQDQFDWIIRSEGTRVLNKEDKHQASTSVHQALAASKPLFTRKLDIRARHSWGSETVKHSPAKADRRARKVHATVHASSVTINDSRPRKPDGIDVNAILVRETKPNSQDQPLEWLLLTSLPINTRARVERIVEYYMMRWMIEIFFKVLKSGCRIESRRFENIDRVLSALALYLIVAWRTFYVCRLSRSLSGKPCTVLYAESEWKSVWTILKKSTPPRKPPELMEMTKLVAQLGGYVERRGVGPPGPQTIWLGLQRMHDFATAWQTFQATQAQ